MADAHQRRAACLREVAPHAAQPLTRPSFCAVRNTQSRSKNLLLGTRSMSLYDALTRRRQAGGPGRPSRIPSLT
ncbi:hypothetical protein CBM2634_A10031 [Cupriavidus taiwanensis]|uniref:Uncharacterized protein n=1 Tax=Cupriavidus taiwanensis TaxID=164546 RepID=A0A375ITD1_9BURK|nr:hypothetical protein CBM2634_A10031 [Cupriavidus taiwanensis]